MNKETLTAVALSESVRMQRVGLLSSTLSALIQQARNIGTKPISTSRIEKAIKLLDTLEYCEDTMAQLVELNQDYRAENNSLRNGIVQQRMINNRSKALAMKDLKLEIDEFEKG